MLIRRHPHKQNSCQIHCSHCDRCTSSLSRLCPHEVQGNVNAKKACRIRSSFDNRITGTFLSCFNHPEQTAPDAALSSTQTATQKAGFLILSRNLILLFSAVMGIYKCARLVTCLFCRMLNTPKWNVTFSGRKRNVLEVRMRAGRNAEMKGSVWSNNVCFHLPKQQEGITGWLQKSQPISEERPLTWLDGWYSFLGITLSTCKVYVLVFFFSLWSDNDSLTCDSCARKELQMNVGRASRRDEDRNTETLRYRS